MPLGFRTGGPGSVNNPSDGPDSKPTSTVAPKLATPVSVGVAVSLPAQIGLKRNHGAVNDD